MVPHFPAALVIAPVIQAANDRNVEQDVPLPAKLQEVVQLVDEDRVPGGAVLLGIGNGENREGLSAESHVCHLADDFINRVFPALDRGHSPGVVQHDPQARPLEFDQLLNVPLDLFLAPGVEVVAVQADPGRRLPGLLDRRCRRRRGRAGN